MNLNQIQNELKEWQEYNFPGRPLHQPMMGLMEELGELSHAVLKREQKIRLEEDHDAAIKDAVADIAIFLMDFCNSEGLCLGDCIEETWNKVKQRDWKKYKEEKGV